ncbi:Farnesyl diphosphate synthase [Methyloligella halotolerans]|uniref:Probable farnesyl diphosphate synthase n=1 Tax=Methyloligella halotolerans TaxID=1177755 RepID=A0A1E2RVK0_9HYPH|nr:farnesyl diphosphate synthase [Methyloligella halotolerans]ODA66241.1 Farnesyl diphosphate synthase [Methyloligella halotolerans]
MTFQQELDRIADLTGHHLGGLLDRHLAGEDPARVGEAMRHALLGGGKRVRPYLVIASAKLFGVAEEDAMPAAAALECLHTYSLVHDDLPAMDDDDLRRGRPTVHVAYDEATAILVGDALLTLAFETLADPNTHPDPAIRASLVLALAKAAGTNGMVGGQALDLAAEGKQLSADEVLKLQAMKTGALFRFACEAGAILGGAGEEQRAALIRYGTDLGQAFQLADDLLDHEGDAEAAGKAVAKDAERGKATLVALLGVDAAKARLETLVADAGEALSPFGDDASNLVEAARFVAGRKT